MRTNLMILAGAVVVGAATLAGQAQRQPATLEDVVNELRALRAELRQSSGGNARMQLLIARLGAQEQRIGVLVSQRANITPRLIEATRQREEVESQVKRLEDMNTRHLPSEVPPGDLEGMLENFKNTLARFRDAERQLRAQDDQLAAQIASEQNRWLDFSNRLDELERPLK
jgi:chromosome segregation ATPase